MTQSPILNFIFYHPIIATTSYFFLLLAFYALGRYHGVKSCVKPLQEVVAMLKRLNEDMDKAVKGFKQESD